MILHVDGDAFFVACEIASRPHLRGKPVVTGAERGIASAMSYEAKALGITRAMPVFHIRKYYPEVIVLESDYKIYQMYSARMVAILRRFSENVEEYSIDECFAEISDDNPESIAKIIQNTLYEELGISFSIGVSVNKVLAKVASKHNKPKGITIIRKHEISSYVKTLPVSKVWGIGGQTSAMLSGLGIHTVQDFLDRGERWVTLNCAKPYHKIWLELSGIRVHDVCSRTSSPKSISSTESFPKIMSTKQFLFTELSRHVEDVTRKARGLSLVAGEVSFFIKTAFFTYKRERIILTQPHALESEILSLMKKPFEHMYDPRVTYRASGVTLHALRPQDAVSNDLFGGHKKLDSMGTVMSVADILSKRFGRGIVHMASSLESKRKKRTHMHMTRKRFNIPMLGKVR